MNWDDDVGATAYSLYYTRLGDMTVARKQAGKAAATYAKIAAKVSIAPAAAELTELRAALAAGVTAFAKKMTITQFDAAYSRIADAFEAFGNKCDDISNWVSESLPK